MDGLKLEDLANRIEEVINRLPEPGDKVYLLQQRIFSVEAQIRSLECAIEDKRRWNERDRETLFEMVRRNWTDSEIEAADVMVTRLRP